MSNNDTPSLIAPRITSRFSRQSMAFDVIDLRGRHIVIRDRVMAERLRAVSKAMLAQAEGSR